MGTIRERNRRLDNGPRPEANEFGAWWGALRTYSWLILLCTVLFGALAFGWVSRQPKIFEASCTIQHIPDPPQPLGHKVEGISSPFSYFAHREYFATQNRIIASRTVAERVVSELGLNRDASFIRPGADGKTPTITQAAKRLQSMLNVSPERDTRLVELRVQDTDPRRAVLLADTVADAYIAKTMEDRMGSTSAALEWLGQQLEGLKKQLESSELALHDFKDKHNVLSISLEDRQNIVASDIERYSIALSAARTRRIELKARLEALREANAEDPFSVHADATDTSDAIKQIRDQYRTVQGELTSLGVEFGPAHPQMKALANRLNLLREQLRKEIDGIIARAESDLREATATEHGIRAALEDANQSGLRLNLREIEYRRLVRARDNTDRLYNTVLERTADTDLTRALKVQYVQVVDRAIQPTVPIRPRVPITVALGALLGLAVGLGLAFMLQRMDRIVRTVEQAEGLGVTVLGILPEIDGTGGPGSPKRRFSPKERAAQVGRDLIVHSHPRSAVAECCRTIRTNFTFAATDRPHRTLLITSAGPREGKTTISISLAISLAQSGKRVLLIDTDLRKPRVHRAFGLRSGIGVTSVLVGKQDLLDSVQATKVPGLTFMASGPIPPNPAELLHTDAFHAMLERCQEEFDLVILDSPPLAAVTDAAVIAPQVDGVLVVIHSARASRDAVANGLRQLRDVGAHLIGAVLNGVDLNRQKYGYGSYYYYRSEGYYATDGDAEERPAAES